MQTDNKNKMKEITQDKFEKIKIFVGYELLV